MNVPFKAIVFLATGLRRKNGYQSVAMTFQKAACDKVWQDLTMAFGRAFSPKPAVLYLPRLSVAG
jgi:hypothetical protein